MLESPLTPTTSDAENGATPEVWAPSKGWNTTEELLKELPTKPIGENVEVDDDILFAQLHAGTLFAEWDDDEDTFEPEKKRPIQVKIKYQILDSFTRSLTNPFSIRQG